MHWIWRTLVLGLGFLAINTVQPLYDGYMPIFYDAYLGKGVLVGMIMGIDNVLGLTVQPYFGALSDQTRTRFGRRIPYLLAGLPVTAVCLVLLPLVKDAGLGLLLAVTILLNLALASYRSPTVALMPDIIPSHLRSPANGIINFMGGVGFTLMLLLGSLLAQRLGILAPFAASAAILVLVLIAFLLFIREPREAAHRVEETPGGLRDALVRLVTVRDPRVWVLCGAIFAWTLAQQAGQTWFTTYGKEALGLPPEASMPILAAFSGTFLLTAPLAGIPGYVIGRRRSMCAGALIMAAAMGGVAVAGTLVHLLVALAVGGLGWALIIVNALPAMVELAPEGQTGTYTGIYYICGGVAAAISPAIFGAIQDAMGWRAVWTAAAGVLLVAAGVVSRARGIEPPARTQEQAA